MSKEAGFFLLLLVSGSNNSTSVRKFVGDELDEHEEFSTFTSPHKKSFKPEIRLEKQPLFQYVTNIIPILFFFLNKYKKKL